MNVIYDESYLILAAVSSVFFELSIIKPMVLYVTISGVSSFAASFSLKTTIIWFFFLLQASASAN